MKKGFKSNAEYEKYLRIYQRLEYESLDEYLLDLAEKHGFDSINELMEQMPETSFEPWLTFTNSIEILERSYENNPEIKLELTELLERTLEVLNEKEQTIIRKIFFEGQAGPEIAKSFGNTNQGINFTKQVALQKLRERAERNGLVELFK